MVPTDRPYQKRTFEAIRAAVRAGHRRILCVLPTGAGKGFMGARLMQLSAEKGNRSIFFGDQRELIYQIDNQLNRLGVPSSVLMSGVKNEYESADDYGASTMCLSCAKDTLWSRAVKRGSMEMPPADVIHVDEAHKSIAKTWAAVTGQYQDAIVIGWTATPCRTDGRGMGDQYDTLIVAATYRELQQSGWLVPVKIFAPSRPDLEKLKVSRGDYNKSDLESRMNRDEMVGCIVSEWRKNADDRQTVAFSAGVKHSIHIRNEFRKIGVTAEHIDGKMPKSERDDIIGRVKDGLVRVFTNYGIAHTGVDIPQWKYMICARPTKSLLLTRQMAGRIQRPIEGHDHCVIQDHSDNYVVFSKSHGFPDEDIEWTLDAKEKQPEKKKSDIKRCSKCHRVYSGSRCPNCGRDPYACEECGVKYRGPHCPKCGHVPEKRGEEILMNSGELQELERRRANKNATPMDKQTTWDECLGWAIGTGKIVGAAAHRYKDVYGVFPNNSIENVPRSSQWKMNARTFYNKVVKPEKEAAKRESEMALF